MRVNTVLPVALGLEYRQIRSTGVAHSNLYGKPYLAFENLVIYLGNVYRGSENSGNCAGHSDWHFSVIEPFVF